MAVPPRLTRSTVHPAKRREGCQATPACLRNGQEHRAVVATVTKGPTSRSPIVRKPHPKAEGTSSASTPEQGRYGGTTACIRCSVSIRHIGTTYRTSTPSPTTMAGLRQLHC